ncbi:MAG: type II toxin-antitoxin system RelE/ParE family toxin [bacterium]|nr:type II toxin-antitoxin system RelE/ParE family toxin [bacterium]
MSYRIVPTPEFIKLTKRLSKKYPLLAKDLTRLQKILTENPKSGTQLGNHCYKIRLQNTSIQKGKSGGFRVIIFLIDPDKVVRLLSIYSKSEKSSISDAEIEKILKNNNLIQ